jgi:Plasmid pRiA4b ORF-3-like protein
MGSNPPIWRRLAIPADITLDRLHYVIQIAMGWSDDHLHQFIVGHRNSRRYFGQTDLEFDDFGDDMLDERRYTVAQLAPAKKSKFIYEYDFGDSWEHEVVHEGMLPSDAALKHAVCLDGENACPPEDCGGIGGYYSLLEILADPKHPERAELKEWHGGSFKPDKFNLKSVNAQLSRIRV